jgi:hypothetical protein
MPAKRPPRGPWIELLHRLWRQPLYAIPFALFFGVLNGAGSKIFFFAYIVSLYFTFTIGIILWAVEYFVSPRIKPPESKGLNSVIVYMLPYAGGSIFGAFLAAYLVRITIAPTFLGTGREVASLAMFTLLFTALFMGLSAAVYFYHKTIEKTRAEQELQLARRIQNSFLPSQFPRMPRLEVHAVNISSREVSGDFYDVVPAGPDAFLIAIADVAGKGVGAALMSSMLQASLRTQATTIPSVAAILHNINTLVYRSTAVHQFATFFLARVEEDTLRMSYSNAGHNYPLVFRKAGGRVPLVRGGTVVGIIESLSFDEDSLALAPGDRIVLYTDGISEAARADGEMFGEERLIAFVESLPADLSAREVTEHVLGAVKTFLAGSVAGDDMTLMVLRVLEWETNRAIQEQVVAALPSVTGARLSTDL